ncbi:IPT/TIG domain-containing protein [Paenibacillus alba]|uniref:glycosyl hydrolase n=1 Tax=Paenibacillus alba TaxID=1197127 RepID=UPI001564BE21|nr:glycosyl hydrolase [Paenibacillus alba]NQX68276.1 IPT/TIG domain-containing protein [Paenibacillus alba]
MSNRKTKLVSACLSTVLLISLFASMPDHAAAATVNVGAGSYTTTLPAGAIAPQGTIYKTANVTGAMPTNDWWSSAAWDQYSDVMFPHPFGIVAGASGLGVSYPVQSASADAMFGAYSNDFTLGSTATSNFPDTRVDGFSDWTVSMLWNNGAGGTMRVTSGHGLPFIYSTYVGGTPKLTFSSVPTIWSGSASTSVLGVTVNGHHYALFGPTGSTWTGIGSTTLTNSLAGKNYFSVALLPDNTAATLAAYKTYGYSFVTNTQSSFAYDASASKVNTTYTVTTQAMEGSQTGTILALYPAQWKNTSQPFAAYTYDSVRGLMKTVTGSSFTTSLTYNGILPALPAVGGYQAATLTSLVDAVKNEPNHTVGATDTYWLGKYLGRIANLLPISQQVGNTAASSNFESYLENTLSANFVASGKSNNLFYYDANWGTLIGYPASYGSDSSLNDHHFHYGYWIRAAAEVARNNPTWASQANFGGMVNLLIKDIANWDRTDTRFPYLRNFDPYEGHSWASGDAKFADGNNNESSSEGINAWAGLILWGQATGNTTIRDLGIYLYTTETNAVNEYWFNINNTNFKAGYNHNYASMIWGGKSVYATWFTDDPQKIRGINILPVTAASAYLGNNPTYSSAFINQLKTEFGSDHWTSWPDILWEYQSLYDAPGAISLYNANPNYTPEDGESKAHTYSFLYNMAALGQVDTTVTANIPTYGVFKKGTVRTYVAYNAGTSAVTVTFSDGKTMSVPAGEIASSNGTGTNPTITSLSPASGTVGTSVTLSGVNFGAAQGASTLKFGTTTAAVTSWSSTSITATVPSGLAVGSYNVVATVNGTASNSQTFTVTSGGGGGATSKLYVNTGGVLSGAAGTGATTNTIASAGGTNHDGTPTNATTYLIAGLNGTYDATKATGFNLFVDAGANVGDGLQVQVQYDFTGDGTWDRTETYNYFATNPVVDWENYTQGQGLKSAAGSFANLVNGKVRINVWNAIGSTATTLRTNASSANGQQSVVTIPFN